MLLWSSSYFLATLKHQLFNSCVVFSIFLECLTTLFELVPQLSQRSRSAQELGGISPYGACGYGHYTGDVTEIQESWRGLCCRLNHCCVVWCGAVCGRLLVLTMLLKPCILLTAADRPHVVKPQHPGLAQ